MKENGHFMPQNYSNLFVLVGNGDNIFKNKSKVLMTRSSLFSLLPFFFFFFLLSLAKKSVVKLPLHRTEVKPLPSVLYSWRVSFQILLFQGSN